MARDDTEALYRGYLECLNARDWDRLGAFVHPEVRHNGRPLALAGYRGMLEDNVRAVPDLAFRIEWLAVAPPLIAARLCFDCTPAGRLFGLPVDGRRVRFAENVFYEVREGRIADVRSVVDMAAIAEQVGAVYRVP